MTQKIPLRYLLFFSVLAFLGGAAGSALNAIQSEERVYIEASDLISTIERVSPAIVKITSINHAENPSFLKEGSGFIVSEDGLMITSYHVVSSPEADYKITLKDGREFYFDEVIRHETEDLAMIRLISTEGDAVQNLPTVKLSKSDALKAGQQVIAMGHDMVSSGIVSNINQSITAGSFKEIENLTNLIQTDAVIGFGSSGGPLINLKGEVVGMNTALDTTNGQVSFAIPVNQVKKLVKKGL